MVGNQITKLHLSSSHVSTKLTANTHTHVNLIG